MLEDVVIYPALIGVERVVSRGGEPFAGAWPYDFRALEQVAGRERHGLTDLHRLAELFFDGDINHRLEIRAAEAVGLFRDRVVIDVLHRFSAKHGAEDGAA